MDKANCHGQPDHPRTLLLEEPSQLLHAAMEEGVAGDGVPALGRQGLLEGQVVGGTVRTAASNLK